MREAPPASRRTWRVAGAAACATVLLALAPSLPFGVGWDNRVKLQVAVHLLRGEGPALTEPTPWDEAYVVLGADGTRYAGYPLLASVIQFVTVWAVDLAGARQAALPALLLLAGTAWVLVLWGRRSGASAPAAVAGALAVATTTALWPVAAYGHDNVAEALALAALLWAVTGAERLRAWALAGVAVGGAIAIRYGAGVLVVPAAVAILAQAPRGVRPFLRRGAAFALGCLPGAALVLGYNVYRFGSPFTFDTRTTGMSNFWVPWFSRHHWEGIAGLLVSPGKGALWYGLPLVGVLLLAPRLARRYPAAFAVIGAYTAAGALAYGRLWFWHGDYGWGPRYIVPVYVAVAPLAWWAWDAVVRRGTAVRVAAAAGFCALALAQAVAATTFPQDVVQLRVVHPLARAGLLVTRPLSAPPDPADNAVLYFRPRSSPLLVAAELARDVVRGDVPEYPQRLPQVRENLAWATLAPALALACMLAVAALARRPAPARCP